MKDLVVLTYDAPHRKTEDVVWRLLCNGYSDFQIIGLPWVERKPRQYIYSHRPAEHPWPCEPTDEPSHLYARLGIRYEVCQPDLLYSRLAEIPASLVVVGGAGILPGPIVTDFKVLNVHPGFLPWSRGLDILKWTVLELNPVGATAHLCDENADLGWKIFEEPVPVYHQDSFHSFAMRQYEIELSLLARAIPTAISTSRESLKRIEAQGTDSRRRMPRKIEAALPEAFERYKRIYA